MEESQFHQVEDWERVGLKTVGDYIVITSPADLDVYCNCHYLKKEQFANQTEYPFLVSMAQGDENMWFIPLTRKDVLEMLSAML